MKAAGETEGRVRITAAADSDASFLREKGGELGLPQESLYTDYRAMVEQAEADAVSICTPHHTHEEIALAAAEAGKHVLCEKPIALTKEAAGRMMSAAEENGVRLYVAENAVYTPFAEGLREMISSGRHVGELLSGAVFSGFRAGVFRYPGRREWLTRPEQGGTGTWMLQGIHLAAQIRYVFGEVETVYMREHHASDFATPELEGSVTGLLGLSSGATVSLLHSCETRLKGEMGGFRIFGTEGNVRADEQGCTVFPNDKSREPYAEEFPEAPRSSFARELEAFADYVETGVPGPTTAESETRSLEVVLAGYRSIRTGSPVQLTSR